MRFFKETNIDFIGARYKSFVITIIVFLICVGAFIYRGGPNYGIDFTGGILMQISFAQKVEMQNLRDALERTEIGSFELQSSDNLFIIRAKKNSAQEEFENAVKVSASDAFPQNQMTIEKVEYVGPTVGEYLSKQALYAFFFSFLGMIIYIALRFKSPLWGISGVVGIIHDVVVAFGFAILVNKEINITVIAALLTVAGFSINDTIVLFDRIRENLKLMAKQDFAAVINRSINQILLRSIVTTITVFIVAAILFFLGGEVIHTFAYIMLIGTVVGVYSSIYLCAPLVYEWEMRKRERMKAARVALGRR
ncbi:MAG: protein translocase subunit SecF [Endomicrobium sp.]|nr:protein translocase subunit SecF [Endomicrobium sp.]